MSPTKLDGSPLARKKGAQGFSLIEILVVLSIASILSLLITTGLQSAVGTAYSSETSDIANTLVRARAYAMANNTYVFVGIQEVLVTNPSTGSQTAPAAGSVGGRIGVTVVASTDGTRIYSTSAPAALAASGLTVVSPLRHYDNLHITVVNPTTSPAFANNLPNVAATSATFNLALPSSTSTLSYQAASTSLTTFQWPLSGTAQYFFGSNSSSPGTVIQFNPQGEAQIVTGANTDSILQWIEIDLVPTHGTNLGTGAKNPATILIDGASGSVSTYRAT